MPTIVFHGDADTTVHPANGEHLFEAGAPIDAIRPGTNPGGRAWTRRVRFDSQGRPVAEHWQVHGAKHAWSGGSSGGSYTDPAGPDATAAMLDFFWAHAVGPPSRLTRWSARCRCPAPARPTHLRCFGPA